MSRTPFHIRRIVSFIPLCILGLIEEVFDMDFDVTSPSIRRFHRWGTWRQRYKAAEVKAVVKAEGKK